MSGDKSTFRILFHAKEERIEMPWGLLAIKTWNSPNFAPMLVVHGLWDNAGVYDILIPLLDKNFFFVCPDLPGHGYSAPFQSGMPLMFTHYVAVLQRIIAIYKWQKFSLMGHSFGSNLCLFLAALHSSQVEKLILLDSTIHAATITPDLFLVRCKSELEDVMKIEKRSAFYYKSEDAAIQGALERVFPITKTAINAILNRSLVRTSEGYKSSVDRRIQFNMNPPINQKVLLNIVKSLHMPILIVYGKNTELSAFFELPLFHEVMEILKHSNPFSKVVWVDGNHCFHCNNPETLAPVLNEFMRELKSKI